MDELKPCPFCAGEPNLTHSDYVHDDLRPMPVVECKSCSAWVRVEDWNRRAADDAEHQVAQLAARNAALVKLLQRVDDEVQSNMSMSEVFHIREMIEDGIAAAEIGRAMP